ncbi:hypothetical protein B0H15DRAFT_804527 [Mycena belliarum]|uniref:Uncharacterized protein n=1 Tax=Mycena belliarum TaxID=1033014 RepID=A0AAD6XLY1_9AGAR|nr:hypothetical protein B0H15DRAFT_804527 [Mycena belliae]
MADLSLLTNTLTAILQQIRQTAAPTASAPIASAPSPVPVLPTPAITSYTSARAQALPSSSLGHPASSTASSSAFPHQPMLGIAGLGINIGGHSNTARLSNRSAGTSTSQLTAPQISQANSGRHHAILSHFPPSQVLPVRGRRRGPAVHPPALNRGPPPTLLDTVSFIDGTTGTRMMRIKLEVNPPSLAFLAEHHLSYDFVLPENTPVVDLLRIGSRAMQDGPGSYQFGIENGTRASRHQPHETLPLQILALINKGNARNNGVSYLTSHYPVALSMTIANLTDPVPAMRSKFGHPSLCVERDHLDGAQLIIRAVIRRAGVRFTSTVGDPMPRTRTHTCLSTRYAHLIDEVTEGDFHSEDGDSTESATSGGESLSDIGEEDDVDMPEALLASSSVSAPGRHPDVPAPSRPEYGIPARVFATPFVPRPAGPYKAVFDAANQLKAVYALASGGAAVPSLDVGGTDFDAMVDAYIKHFQSAADAGDYTTILSPRRCFKKLHPDGTALSTGVGLERELLYGIFLRFSQEPEKYFSPREQGRCTISMTISMAHRFLVPAARLRELKLLGAVIMLMLLHGMTPEPLSPALFQYFLHGCNLNALTPEFLSEWYPALRVLLSSWVEMGPTGELGPYQAHFSKSSSRSSTSDKLLTQHKKVASLQTRDQAQHDALGAEMLYTAIFGPQPPSHPEYKALFSGMEMFCRSGFTMLELFRSFPGGTERLLSQKWASHIHDFASIEPNLAISCPSATEVARLTGPLLLSVDPTEILRGFLQRTGIPCPGIFAITRETIHPMVLLDDVDSPAFRPRIFAWACTGSPDSELSKDIHVIFSTPSCLDYRGDPVQREINMANGTIAFASCFRTARIPLSYLVDLHRASYPSLDALGQPIEPLTLQDAIDSWLFMQIVGAIGDISSVKGIRDKFPTAIDTPRRARPSPSPAHHHHRRRRPHVLRCTSAAASRPIHTHGAERTVACRARAHELKHGGHRRPPARAPSARRAVHTAVPARGREGCESGRRQHEAVQPANPRTRTCHRRSSPTQSYLRYPCSRRHGARNHRECGQEVFLLEFPQISRYVLCFLRRELPALYHDQDVVEGKGCAPRGRGLSEAVEMKECGRRSPTAVDNAAGAPSVVVVLWWWR